MIKEEEVDFVDLHFVFGVESIDMRHPNPAERQWDSEFLGQLVWDSNFDISNTNSQKYLFDLCHIFFNFHMAGYENVSCWMYPFWNYVRKRGLTFPIADRNLFHSVLEEWAETEEGQLYFHERKEVYLVNNQIKFFKIVVNSNLTYYNATAADHVP